MEKWKRKRKKQRERMKREWVEQEKWWLCRGDESGGREKKNKRVRVSGTEGWNGKRERKRERKHYLIEDQIK